MSQYYFERKDASGATTRITDDEVKDYLAEEIREGRLVQEGSGTSNVIVAVLRALRVHELPHDHSRHGYVRHVIDLMKGRIKGAFQRHRRAVLYDNARQAAADAEQRAQEQRDEAQRIAIRNAVEAATEEQRQATEEQRRAEEERRQAEEPRELELQPNEEGLRKVQAWMDEAPAEYIEQIYMDYFAGQGESIQDNRILKRNLFSSFPILTGGQAAISDGQLVAVRDIAKDSILDHSIGNIISVERRQEIHRQMPGRTHIIRRKGMMHIDESLISVQRPLRMRSKYEHAYFDTNTSGTRLIEYIAQKPGEEGNFGRSQCTITRNTKQNLIIGTKCAGMLTNCSRKKIAKTFFRFHHRYD